MPGYGQFCPVAKAMEVLDQRWTMLVIRELLTGSTRFNELRRGLTRMSPALLSARLRSLEHSGLIDRVLVEGTPEYHLTEAGRELSVVVDALSAWGLRWVPELGDEDLDPHLLMFDIHRKIPADAWPRRRTVVAFRFEDLVGKAAAWWLVVEDGEVDLCDADPGFEVAATVSTRLRTLTRIWRGDLPWSGAIREHAVTIQGVPTVRRALPDLIGHGRHPLTPIARAG
ncbi:MAG: winged helix-turn-helix transcriptional regulator [Actinomycetes bacterium]